MGPALLACALLALSVACTVDPTSCADKIIDRGSGWREMGGPRAFVHARLFVAHDAPQKVWVRFEDSAEQPLSIEAQLLGADLREEGVIQPAIDRDDWAPGAGPPDDLPGTEHLAIIRLPRPGCWQLTLRAGPDVVGTARIDVQLMGAEFGGPRSRDVYQTLTEVRA